MDKTTFIFCTSRAKAKAEAKAYAFCENSVISAEHLDERDRNYYGLQDDETLPCFVCSNEIESCNDVVIAYDEEQSYTCHLYKWNEDFENSDDDYIYIDTVVINAVNIEHLLQKTSGFNPYDMVKIMDMYGDEIETIFN